MGFFKAPTTGIALFGPRMRWAEPAFFEARRKQQVGSRLAMIVTLPIGVIILMEVVAAVANKPGFTPGNAFAAGLVIGVALALTVFAREWFGGRVRVDKKGIHRSRSAKLVDMLALTSVVEYEDWPYGAIQQCCILPGKSTKHGMSILEVHTHEGRDAIGISKLVNQVELAKFLQGHGVAVSFPRGFVSHQVTLVDRVMSHLTVPMVLAGVLLVAIIVGMAGSRSSRDKGQDPGSYQAERTEWGIPDNVAERAKPPELDRSYPGIHPDGSVSSPHERAPGAGSAMPKSDSMRPKDIPLRPDGIGRDRFGGRGGPMVGPSMGGGPSRPPDFP